jgi:protein-tyrosine-phosphatase
MSKPRVLFLCTGNSARSQLAEAIFRQQAGDSVEVVSAGSEPRPEIHPMARKVAREVYGLDLAGQHPKPLIQFLDERFDYVITVCDRAAESCPVFPGDPEMIRWSFEDPAAVEGSEDEVRHAFERTARELSARIRLLINLPRFAQRA